MNCQVADDEFRQLPMFAQAVLASRYTKAAFPVFEEWAKESNATSLLQWMRGALNVCLDSESTTQGVSGFIKACSIAGTFCDATQDDGATAAIRSLLLSLKASCVVRSKKFDRLTDHEKASLGRICIAAARLAEKALLLDGRGQDRYALKNIYVAMIGTSQQQNWTDGHRVPDDFFSNDFQPQEVVKNPVAFGYLELDISLPEDLTDIEVREYVLKWIKLLNAAYKDRGGPGLTVDDSYSLVPVRDLVGANA